MLEIQDLQVPQKMKDALKDTMLMMTISQGCMGTMMMLLMMMKYMKMLMMLMMVMMHDDDKE